MVERLQCFLRIDASGAEQKAEELLVFGVDAEDRVRRFLIRGSVVGDDVELPITLGVLACGKGLLSFAVPQTMAVEQLCHHRNADVEAKVGEFFSNLGPREIGPQNPLAHGIACQVRIDDFEKSCVEARQQAQAGFSATPFFRERPGGKKRGCSSSRRPRRMVFRSQPKSCAM